MFLCSSVSLQPASSTPGPSAPASGRPACAPGHIPARPGANASADPCRSSRPLHLLLRRRRPRRSRRGERASPLKTPPLRPRAGPCVTSEDAAASAILVAERFADGEVTKAELTAADKATYQVYPGQPGQSQRPRSAAHPDLHGPRRAQRPRQRDHHDQAPLTRAAPATSCRTLILRLYRCRSRRPTNTPARKAEKNRRRGEGLGPRFLSVFERRTARWGWQQGCAPRPHRRPDFRKKQGVPWRQVVGHLRRLRSAPGAMEGRS
jgi:hypothetical protein